MPMLARAKGQSNYASSNPIDSPSVAPLSSMSFLKTTESVFDGLDAAMRTQSIPDQVEVSGQVLSAKFLHGDPHATKRSAVFLLRMLKRSEQSVDNVASLAAMAAFKTLHGHVWKQEAAEGVHVETAKVLSPLLAAISSRPCIASFNSPRTPEERQRSLQESSRCAILSALLMAMEAHELCGTALEVLNKVVHQVGEVDLTKLADVLPVTVHAVVAIYPTCLPQEQATCSAILHYLLVESRNSLQDAISSVESLPRHPEWQQMAETVASVKASMPAERRIKRLLVLVNQGRAGVSSSAMHEIRDLLLALALEPSKSNALTKSVATTIIQGLATGMSLHGGRDDVVSRLCAECLGILGAIVPGMVSLQRLVTAPLLSHGFADVEWVKDVACLLIEQQSIGTACSIGNIDAEIESAYATQVLLAFGGITKEVFATPGGLIPESSSTQAMARWNKFPASSKEFLEPFVDAMSSIVVSKVKP
ncbi:hypothetical protein BG004_001346, partial [Podila humilis]